VNRKPSKPSDRRAEYERECVDDDKFYAAQDKAWAAAKAAKRAATKDDA